MAKIEPPISRVMFCLQGNSAAEVRVTDPDMTAATHHAIKLSGLVIGSHGPNSQAWHAASVTIVPSPEPADRER